MAGEHIARVFVRKTQYTPDDDLVFFGPPGLLMPEVDEVHVSCVFSWDRKKAERLANVWKGVAPVKIGGPAYPGTGGDEFIPNRYVGHGHVFTSRGCNRKCPFCLVHKQEGGIRELAVIHSGNKIMDNNLLACSRRHVEAVFTMLEGQRDVMLKGGLDIRLFAKWHAERIAGLHLRNLAVAYDTKGVEGDLDRILRLLHGVGIPHGKIHCFVLGGFFDWDTPEKAEQRCRLVLKLGATPSAMCYRGMEETEIRKPVGWRKWAIRWQWQKGIYAMAKREGLETYQGRQKCK